MFYLTGFLRTENSLKNERCRFNPYFSGWGREFITPLSTDNIINLQDNTASVQFDPFCYFSAKMSSCGECSIAFHVIEPNSLRLVQGVDRIDGILPQTLANRYGGRMASMEIPLIKKEIGII